MLQLSKKAVGNVKPDIRNFSASRRRYRSTDTYHINARGRHKVRRGGERGEDGERGKEGERKGDGERKKGGGENKCISF